MAPLTASAAPNAAPSTFAGRWLPRRRSAGSRLMRIIADSSGCGGEPDRDGELGRQLVECFDVDVVGPDLQAFDRVPGLGALLEDLLEALLEERQQRGAA